MSRRAAVITLVVMLVVAWGSLLATQLTGTTPQLGLDLQGGFSVALEAPAGTDEDVLEKAVEIMRERIEALGNVQEPEIAVAGERILVQLPGVTDRDRALAAVGTTGQLSFRPVLEISPVPGISPLLLNAAADAGAFDDATGDTETPIVDFSGDEPVVESTTTTAVADETTTTVPEDPLAGIEITPPAGIEFCGDSPSAGCIDENGFTVVPDPDKDAWLLTAPEDGSIAYHLAPARVLGSDLADASARFQQQGGGATGFGVGGGVGSWVVLLDFSSEGATKFQQTTAQLASYGIGDPRRQFAIVLDGTVQSAPQVAADVGPEGISGGTAIITLGGAQDQQSEASNLAVVLRYGALPVALEQANIQSVSATLGEDSLNAGLIAGIGGLILVAIAMILYYRALGLVNVIGLTVFGSIVITVYALLGEFRGVTLTLAGIAGVIVSVGITSDSYIVYYERIKEEVHRGRSLRSAIDHAFKRSFRTILTADTVSFAGAVLLFLLAVGSVKGFALALLIATVTDVFVAYFYTRPAVALLARTRLGEGGRLSIRGATGRAPEVVA
ncbi:MAG TPA: protein translocase subunit SecD [Acidimicrobiia bacterium]|nr:protein translocase subunit SecD [Acidimicrobiia bacterium]